MEKTKPTIETNSENRLYKPTLNIFIKAHDQKHKKLL